MQCFHHPELLFQSTKANNQILYILRINYFRNSCVTFIPIIVLARATNKISDSAQNFLNFSDSVAKFPSILTSKLQNYGAITARIKVWGSCLGRFNLCSLSRGSSRRREQCLGDVSARVSRLFHNLICSHERKGENDVWVISKRCGPLRSQLYVRRIRAVKSSRVERGDIRCPPTLQFSPNTGLISVSNLNLPACLDLPAGAQLTSRFLRRA